MTEGWGFGIFFEKQSSIVFGIGDWVLGCAPWQGVVRYTEGGFRPAEGRSAPSTIYYSTKVRLCDKVWEILIFVCHDFGLERRVFGS
jgi:hypothetical protein